MLISPAYKLLPCMHTSITKPSSSHYHTAAPLPCVNAQNRAQNLYRSVLELRLFLKPVAKFVRRSVLELRPLSTTGRADRSTRGSPIIYRIFPSFSRDGASGFRPNGRPGWLCISYNAHYTLVALSYNPAPCLQRRCWSIRPLQQPIGCWQPHEG
jgi:hypothetical protein